MNAMLRKRLAPRLLACLLVPIPAQVSAAGNPRQDYLLHCAGCHQADGTGSPEHGIPNMKGVVGRFLHLPEGRAFLVKVPGTSQAALDDARIARMLNWMLVEFSRHEIPPGFAPYTTAEVSSYRSAPLDDVSAQRKAIAVRLRQMGHPVD
ncbi:MAG: hypothetical protein OHK0026_00030 [Rhodocyclaceae bacterium]